MIIAKKILKRWEKVISDVGITAVCAGAKVNFRTLKRSLEVGQCKDEVYDRVDAFISEREQYIKKKMSSIEDDNN